MATSFTVIFYSGFWPLLTQLFAKQRWMNSTFWFWTMPMWHEINAIRKKCSASREPSHCHGNWCRPPFTFLVAQTHQFGGLCRTASEPATCCNRSVFANKTFCVFLCVPHTHTLTQNRKEFLNFYRTFGRHLCSGQPARKNNNKIDEMREKIVNKGKKWKNKKKRSVAFVQIF